MCVGVWRVRTGAMLVEERVLVLAKPLDRKCGAGRVEDLPRGSKQAGGYQPTRGEEKLSGASPA